MNGKIRRVVTGHDANGKAIVLEAVWKVPALRLETDEHHRHKDVYQHSLTVMEQAAALESGPDGPVPGPDFALRFAALMHDVGKPATRRFEPGSAARATDGRCRWVCCWTYDLLSYRPVSATGSEKRLSCARRASGSDGTLPSRGPEALRRRMGRFASGLGDVKSTVCQAMVTTVAPRGVATTVCHWRTPRQAGS